MRPRLARLSPKQFVTGPIPVLPANIMEYKVKTFQERFWLKVKKTSNCWNWTGGKFKSGYGTFTIGRKLYRAHRVSWVIHFKEIPSGIQVLHTCDNSLCVKPEHLFLGNHIDNMKDMKNKGRGKSGNTKLNEKQVSDIREMYIPNKFGYTKISRIFNICPSNVGFIIRGQTWKYAYRKLSTV